MDKRLLMPTGQLLSGNLVTEFLNWQKSNQYAGKLFSIMGDSICTLEGYNPIGYRVFFKGKKCEKSGVREPLDTWWGKAVDYLGGIVLVNNSWSGSRASKLQELDTQFPSGCSAQRTNGLHKGKRTPDVIWIYMGTNDWEQSVPMGYPIEEANDEKFAFAYQLMIDRIKRNYPKAEIWCCTITRAYRSKDKKFHFPVHYSGQTMDSYNQVIKEIAKSKNCRVIDFAGFHEEYDSIDGSHPTIDGMNTLAKFVIQTLADDDGKEFLSRGEEVRKASGMLEKIKNFFK